jgi:hypothetical protein
MTARPGAPAFVLELELIAEVKPFPLRPGAKRLPSSQQPDRRYCFEEYAEIPGGGSVTVGCCGCITRCNFRCGVTRKTTITR